MKPGLAWFQVEFWKAWLTRTGVSPNKSACLVQVLVTAVKCFFPLNLCSQQS